MASVREGEGRGANSKVKCRKWEKKMETIFISLFIISSLLKNKETKTGKMSILHN